MNLFILYKVLEPVLYIYNDFSVRPRLTQITKVLVILQKPKFYNKKKKLKPSQAKGDDLATDAWNPWGWGWNRHQLPTYEERKFLEK